MWEILNGKLYFLCSETDVSLGMNRSCLITITLCSCYLISRKYGSSHPEVFLGKGYENLQQIYRRKPMPQCHFNKVALQVYWNHTLSLVFSSKFSNFIEIALRHGCSPIKLLHIFTISLTFRDLERILGQIWYLFGTLQGRI